MSSANLEGETTPDGPIFSTAASPFDDPKADLILRSSDGVHYYIHKLLLSLVSPVFDDMFTIYGDSPQDTYDNRPLVAVDDDSSRLFRLLSWCDPRCIRPTTSLQDLQIVLEMADKYSMDSIVRHIRETILTSTTIIQSAPLKVYAIAIRFRMEDLATKAARETLRLDSLHDHKPIPELKHITGFALANLLEYHFAHRHNKSHLVTDISWIDQSWDSVAFFVQSCGNDGCKMSTKNNTQWLSWWVDYMDGLGTILQSQDTGAAAHDPSLLLKIKRRIDGSPCLNCRKIGYKKLTDFAEIMAKKIDSDTKAHEVAFKVEY
ncbi:hypothetical protein B0H34DRAFT_732383 [Crassisporium funariophilum]|nr:hypothetical protein B0H34DRAFT_732383 [Crassisporium funariophilum]